MIMRTPAAAQLQRALASVPSPAAIAADGARRHHAGPSVTGTDVDNEQTMLRDEVRRLEQMIAELVADKRVLAEALSRTW
jgi:hypothetical protein